MVHPENENNDFYDLHKISPNLRNDMLEIEKQVVAEASSKLKPTGHIAPLSRLDRMKSYTEKHRKEIGFGVGAVALMAVVAGVSWQADNSTQAHNRHALKYALHEVLTHPVDLVALGICPDDLRYQAKKLPPAAAHDYLQAADTEATLGVPCGLSSVASITINLPNADQTVITPVDIVPAIF